MITIRRADDRGQGEHGWLHSRHTFSFAGYFDPDHVQYRTLRVINEDVVEAGRGFGTHPHDNMEILSWVLEGELAHTDSMGREETLHSGMAQVMSAGAGLTHSEFNGSGEKRAHFLQIWILPAKKNTEPRYADRDFNAVLDGEGLVPIASPDERGGSLPIGQDAVVYAARLTAGEELTHKLGETRGAWLQIARGSVDLKGKRLNQGDGAVIEGEDLAVRGLESSEILLFDLA